jgi:ABC-type transport system involved in multi-copper enzyme maturation permease subunit
MTEPRTEWVGVSPSRISAIALNTLTESVRQKVYLLLILVALVFIATASFFSQFSFGSGVGQDPVEQLKFIKDFCLGAISVFGMLIAVVGTAQLLPNEVEHRTIYTVLSKPVRRFEFLLGKYLGSLWTILLSLVVMTLMFFGMLMIKGLPLQHAARQQLQNAPAGEMREEATRVLAKVEAGIHDRDLVKGLLLIAIKLAVLAAITMLVSTFSTSMVFNVATTLLVFFAGHLVGTAKEVWANHALLQYLLAIIPDFSLFDVTDEIVLGRPVPWSHVGKAASYGLVYLSAVVAAAHFIFADREI